MDNFNMLRAFITQFSGKENQISVNTSYCKFVGKDLAVGTFLSQLVYWSDKGKRKDGYFYKTRSEWEDEIFLTDYTIRKATKQLSEMGILETKIMKANGSPTLHYRLNMEVFLEQFGQFLMSESQKKEEKTAETVENTGFVEINDWNLRNQRLESAKSTIGNVESNDSITSITTSTTTDINILSGNQTSPSKIPFFEIVEYLNKKADKKFKSDSKGTQRAIKARFEEGFTFEDFKEVIDIKVSHWLHDESMNQYLRPQTLFGTKFESYLNQKVTKISVGTTTTNDYFSDKEFDE